MHLPGIDYFRRQLSRRTGATSVEAAIVLGVCLFLLLGMLDMSVALVRYNLMSEASRRIARAAIVHGSSARAAQGTWGPTSIATDASSNSPAAGVIRDMLITLDPKDVTIGLQWPDGGNEPDQRARVTVSYTHKPIIAFPGLYSQLDLQGTSTMRIAH